MKILSLTAENVKRLTVVEITPAGNLVQVTGKNGSGKSSVLDAIYMALAGGDAIPSKPVRDGAQSAKIKLDLGEIVITRSFTAGGGTTLRVESAEGERKASPQTLLDALLGKMTFDPLEFTRLKPKDQLERLKLIVPLEVDCDELDKLNAADHAARTDINRDIRALEARISAINVPANLPATAPDVSALVKQLEDAGTHNAAIETRKAKRQDASNAIAAAKQDRSRLLTQIEEIDAEIERLKTKRSEIGLRAQELLSDAEGLTKKLAEAPELPAPIDSSEISAQIQAANAMTDGFRKRDEREKLREQLKTKRSEVEALERAMASRTEAKVRAIKTAKMPVEGLTFGDVGLLMNGLPFDQACSADQLRVSVAVAMAMNSKLRVVRIKDGSLLDEDSLRLIGEMADAADCQVWIERVDSSGKVGIVMEDGHVAADLQVTA